jgi:hypothetical protein
MTPIDVAHLKPLSNAWIYLLLSLKPFKLSGRLACSEEFVLMKYRIGSDAFWLAVAMAAFVFGCNGEDVSEPEPDMSGDRTLVPGCVPDEQRWENTVAPQINEFCGSCHGEELRFGAPVSLTSYAELLEGEEGSRQVDRIAARVAFRTMPPTGMPHLPDDIVESIVDWASCGEIEPELGSGLQVDAPVFVADEEPSSEDWQVLDLLADEFPIAAEDLDVYECFGFDIDLDVEKFVRRLEIVIDRDEVLHHMILLKDVEKNSPVGRHGCPGMPPSSQYIYAWAPGTGAVEFPGGGLRIGPGDRYQLQIHYNNGAALPDVTDSSGVRLYLDAPEGTEYGMFAPGPLQFEIPGRTTQEVIGSCTATEDFEILAGMPHMHETGEGFSQRIERADGTEEPLIQLMGWSFETQLFYRLNKQIRAGDKIWTQCTFHNPNNGPVRSGPNTADEMCFNFMYVTPPPTARYCSDSGDVVEDIVYERGECMEGAGVEEPALVRGRFVVGSPPVLAGGEIVEGIYELSDFAIWRDSADIPIGTLDLVKSFILAKGQVVISDGQAFLDVVSESHIVTENIEVDDSNQNSVRVRLNGAEGGKMNVLMECPREEEWVWDFAFSGDVFVMGWQGSAFGVNFDIRNSFQRVDP